MISIMYSDNLSSLVRTPLEYVHNNKAPLLPSQLHGLTELVLTGHVAGVSLDLLMISTSGPRYLTCSRTGNQQPCTLESTDKVVVMPVLETARAALGHHQGC